MRPWASQQAPGLPLNEYLGAQTIWLPGAVDDSLMTQSGGGGTLTYSDGMLRRSFAANQAARYRTAYDHEKTGSAAILWVGQFLTTPSQFACIGGLTYASTNISPYSALEIKRRLSSGTNTIYLGYSAGGLELSFATTSTITTGYVVIVASSAPSSQSLWVKNVSTGEVFSAKGTSAGALAYGSGSRLEVGDSLNVRNPQAACEMMVLFNRALEDGECVALLENPYLVYAPRVMPNVIASAAAGGFLAAWASQRSRVIGAR